MVKILIVEPDKDIRSLYRLSLEMLGHTIVDVPIDQVFCESCKKKVS